MGQFAKYSNEFLNIGVGARAAGMGNTQAALANDVTAGYWNPAGIAHIQGSPQMGLQHSEMYGSIGKFDYLGFVYPFKDSVWLRLPVGWSRTQRNGSLFLVSHKRP